MSKVITPVRTGKGSKKPYPVAAKNSDSKTSAQAHKLVEIKGKGKVGFTKG